MIERICAKGVNVVIFESACAGDSFFNSTIIRNIKEFKRISDVIVANHKTGKLFEIRDRVDSRDLFDAD